MLHGFDYNQLKLAVANRHCGWLGRLRAAMGEPITLADCRRHQVIMMVISNRKIVCVQAVHDAVPRYADMQFSMPAVHAGTTNSI
jgi:hypothetical protein